MRRKRNTLPFDTRRIYNVEDPIFAPSKEHNPYPPPAQEGVNQQGERKVRWNKKILLFAGAVAAYWWYSRS